MSQLQKFTFFDPGPGRSDVMAIIDGQWVQGVEIILCDASLDHASIISSSFFPHTNSHLKYFSKISYVWLLQNSPKTDFIFASSNSWQFSLHF